MNNQELESKIKEMINMPNMFDMIIAAKEFEKDYKSSDFYKTTKMPLMEMLKDAKAFYTIQSQNIKDKLQAIINELDFNHITEILSEASDVFEKENNDALNAANMLKDIMKNI